ncbi:MAG: hypothetical protein JO372_21450 [Solirubrobacterales bacterium]|nr:hypothetical protein [Solirubrobacterales bacterium]
MAPLIAVPVALLFTFTGCVGNDVLPGGPPRLQLNLDRNFGGGPGPDDTKTKHPTKVFVTWSLYSLGGLTGKVPSLAATITSSDPLRAYIDPTADKGASYQLTAEDMTGVSQVLCECIVEWEHSDKMPQAPITTDTPKISIYNNGATYIFVLAESGDFFVYAETADGS